MHARYPLPRIWLLTDERQGDALWPALRALRPGSGVIVRHYSLNETNRRRLFARVGALARYRRLTVILSGPPAKARWWGADGFYSTPDHRSSAGLLWAATAHDRSELHRAARRGADLVLLSPLFPTRSHPDGRTIGISAFARIAKRSRLPIIALGGVEAKHQRLLRRVGAYGWAGIDAFIEPGKRIRT